MSPSHYYHGGAPGLRVGDKVLPPDQTGADSLKAWGAESCRTDRVYITSSLGWAVFYAAGHPSRRGTIYAVIPDGELEEDPDYTVKPCASFHVRSATVAAVIRLTKRERMAYLSALHMGVIA